MILFHSGQSFGKRFNPTESEPFQNSFQNFSGLFGTDTKNVGNLVWCKLIENQSDSIWWSRNKFLIRQSFEFEVGLDSISFRIDLNESEDGMILTENSF